ncbi:hypothetical protein E3N88_27787 [Mikania micrantha]|uniref:K Homology domain-containing protein n=1 Tax=Mikania micrantha TaxID=192012 RepID=A0A5N6MYM3_9ASTR|nr:hypothetical protein E3N88_27787 [Mikania micrantha]
MEQNSRFDKYAKAKIEAPCDRLPKALLKFNRDPSSGELCYMKIFEDDAQKHKHIAEEMAAGAKLDRKVYRIRNMELSKAIGDDFEDMQLIHRVSKATIGLIVDSECDRHTHSFLDLMGTVAQVKMAEELILDKILTTYESPVFPVILMPPTVYGHEIKLHMDKVDRLLRENCENILAMEVVSGAWMQIDDKPPPGGPKHERTLYIYGPKAHVYKAVSLVHSQVFGPGECLEAIEELDMLFQELSFDEMMEGMKPRTPQMFDLLGADSASGSASDLGSGFGSGSGSGGQTEKQKEQHVEDRDKSEGKHEEDVEEAVCGEEPKESVEQLD